MDFRDLLLRHREDIIQEWVQRLRTEISPRYLSRPVKEYEKTVFSAFDAYFEALVSNNYTMLDRVVRDIGQFRFESGFSLSEVQKAFEIFGYVIIPLVIQEMAGSVPETITAVDRVQVCLNYTIHQFSDFYQALSEKEIRDYAQMLEIKVRDRTQQLAESEAKYRTLVEEIRDGYFVNQDGKIVFSNKAFSEMHGYSVDEVIGRPYTDFVATESLEEVTKTYLSRIHEQKAREHYVYYRRHKDGRSMPTENKVVMTVYEGQRAALGICRDISERLEIEKRVRDAENLARIGEITTSLAHEIRNPLSSARMSIQMLLKSDSFQGNERRRLEILAQEVGRLNRIVSEMLDFAKPMKFKFVPSSLPAFIDSCLDAIDTRIMEKNLKIVKKIGKHLPLVKMDLEKLEQAVINILLNSIEALDCEGIIKILVRHSKKEKNILLQISDNGHGIEPEDLPYIFEPFFTKKSKGSGLGLANARRIIEAHRGTIDLVLARPAGTQANITLPVYEEKPDDTI